MGVGTPLDLLEAVRRGVDMFDCIIPTKMAQQGYAYTFAGLVRIRTAMTDSATVMKEMGRRAEEIGDIVQTINLIADRTNLLSLNASIEAARAARTDD